MGIQVFCPKCDRACRIHEGYLGKRVRCPGCQETFKAEEVPTAELDEPTSNGEIIPMPSSNRPVLSATGADVGSGAAATPSTFDSGTGDNPSIAVGKNTREIGKTLAGTREMRQRPADQAAPKTEFAWDDDITPPNELSSKLELPASRKEVEPPKPKQADGHSPFAFDDEKLESREQRDLKKTEAIAQDQTMVPSAPTPKKIEPSPATKTDGEPNGKLTATIAAKKERPNPPQAVVVPSVLRDAGSKTPAPKTIHVRTPDLPKGDPFAFEDESIKPDETIAEKKPAIVREKLAEAPVRERRAKPRELPRKKVADPVTAVVDDSPFSFFDEGSPNRDEKKIDPPKDADEENRAGVKKPALPVHTLKGASRNVDDEDSSAPKHEVPNLKTKSSQRPCFHVRQSGFWGDARLFRAFVHDEELVFVTAALGKDIGEMEDALHSDTLDDFEKRIRNKVLDLDELSIDELADNGLRQLPLVGGKNHGGVDRRAVSRLEIAQRVSQPVGGAEPRP